VIEVI